MIDQEKIVRAVEMILEAIGRISIVKGCAPHRNGGEDVCRGVRRAARDPRSICRPVLTPTNMKR